MVNYYPIINIVNNKKKVPERNTNISKPNDNSNFSISLIVKQELKPVKMQCNMQMQQCTIYENVNQKNQSCLLLCIHCLHFQLDKMNVK